MVVLRIAMFFCCVVVIVLFIVSLFFFLFVVYFVFFVFFFVVLCLSISVDCLSLCCALFCSLLCFVLRFVDDFRRQKLHDESFKAYNDEKRDRLFEVYLTSAFLEIDFQVSLVERDRKLAELISAREMARIDASKVLPFFCCSRSQL